MGTGSEYQGGIFPVPKETALEVAQFLTAFQSYFRKSNKRNRPISADEIRSAVEYRRSVANHHSLENDWHSMREGNQSENISAKWAKAISESQTKLDATLTAEGELKELDVLLQKFQVWSTKALANNVLLYCTTIKHTGDQGNDRIICCSPLLNLPGALHFSSTMPSIEASQRSVIFQPNIADVYISGTGRKSNCTPSHPCSLPLPPNAHTQQEYLRIAHMVSLLPTPRARTEVHQSSMTAVHFELMPSKEDMKLAENSRFTQTDLVALWVRAQRNSMALRHLLHLFHVTDLSPVEDEPNNKKDNDVVQGIGGSNGEKVGKIIVSESEEKNENGISEKKSTPYIEPKFVAKFIGNHKQIRTRVINESHLVDRLVEWAVMNQVLFTFQHVQKAIELDVTEKLELKRSAEAVPDSQPVAKKRRVDDDQYTRDVLRACHSFVLRWLARRNRKALSILFTATPERKIQDQSVRTIVHDLIIEDVPKKVKDYMQTVESGSTDRTLSRIDRSVHKDKYEMHDEGNSEKQTFYNAVTGLLNALLTCVPHNGSLTQAKIVPLYNDFEALYQIYYQRFVEGGAKAAALALIEAKEIDNIPNLLNSSPAPWLDRCSFCDKGLTDDSFRVCTNCEAPIHVKCAPKGDGQNLSEFLEAYPPLKRAYCMRIPRNVDLPDFASDDKINWIEMEVDLVRESNKTGQMQSLGMGIRSTEQTDELFRRFSSETRLASELMDDTAYPLTIGKKGVLVIDLAEGQAAIRAGIQKNDVITGLEFVHLHASSVTVKTKHEFAFMTQEERIAILRRGVAHLKLTIQRPDKDLVFASKRWLRRVRKANNAVIKALDFDSTASGNMRVWVCPKCQTNRTDTRKKETTITRVLREAEYCRAVIRRLGMEECSLPFHDELVNEAGNKEDSRCRHSQHVSLRRLDSMFSMLMSKPEKTEPKLSFLEEEPIMDMPFNAPPWGESGTRERLKWAPTNIESKPLELLCRGMLYLISDPCTVVPLVGQMEDRHKDDRAALSCMFISIFPSWCLASSILDGTSIITRGPPVSALRSRSPWLLKGCRVCSVRSSKSSNESTTSTSGICCNSHCKKIFDSHLKATKERKERKMKQLKKLEDAAAATKRVSSSDDKDDKWDWIPPLTLPVSMMDREIREYEHCSSFVGTTLLVLPGDPLLQFVARELNWSINHMDRPMELVVVSYLPGSFARKITSNKGTSKRIAEQTENAHLGRFDVLPVLHERQLNYLLNICKMRNPKFQGARPNDLSWLNLDVLNVEGVITLSFAELKKKMIQTVAIQRAIDDAVANIAKSSSRAEIRESIHCNTMYEGHNPELLLLPCRSVVSMSKAMRTEEHDASSSQEQQLLSESQIYTHTSLSNSEQTNLLKNLGNGNTARGCDGSIAMYSILIDSLLQCEHPLLRNLISGLNEPEKTKSTEEVPIITDENAVDTDDDTDAGENDIDQVESTVARNSDSWDYFWHEYAQKSLEIRGTIDKSLSGSFPTHLLSYLELLASASRQACQVCYTDLIVGDAQPDAGATSKLMRELVIKHPATGSGQDNLGRIVLRRTQKEGQVNTNESEYAGVGWGFEVLQWKDDAMRLRVGRIHPKSPAAKVGLKMHDVIMNINGRTSAVESPVELARALLGSNHKASAGASFGAICIAIGERVGSAVTGPLILSIMRKIGSNSTESRKPNTRTDASPGVLHNGKTDSQVQMNCEFPSDTFQRYVSQKSNKKSLYPLSNVVQTIGPRKNALVIQQVMQPAPCPAQKVQVQCISSQDVFRSGFKNSFFSCVEAAFIFECKKRRCPKLGVRLLVPRYDPDFAAKHCRYLLQQTKAYGVIPEPTQELWDFILKHDYERSKLEKGSIWFKEGDFSYRFPIGLLPLDKLSESFLEHQIKAKHKTIGTPPPDAGIARKQSELQTTQHLVSFTNRESQSIAQNDHLSIELLLEGKKARASQGSDHQYTSPDSEPKRVERMVVLPSQSKSKGTIEASQQSANHNTDSLEKQNTPSVSKAAESSSDCQLMKGSTENSSKKSNEEIIELLSSDEERPKEKLNGTDSVLLSSSNILPHKSISSGTKKDGAEPDYLENSCERIRGGGGTASCRLNRIPKSSWKNRLVFGECHTTKDNEANGEAKLVGYVSNPQPEGAQQDEVDVSVFFVSNAGHLIVPMIQRISTAHLFSVTAGSEEAKLAEEWKRQTLQHGPKKESVRKAEENDSKGGVFTLFQASNLLIERLCHRKTGTAHLGYLPDGRAVLWMQSDPGALYLRKQFAGVELLTTNAASIARQRHYRAQIYRDIELRRGLNSTLRLCDRGLHCCIWGCTIRPTSSEKKERQILAFRTEEELRQHMSNCHSFTVNPALNSDDGESLIRLDSGESVCALAADLTASICARCLSLTGFTKDFPSLVSNGTTLCGTNFTLSPTNSRITFSTERMLKLTEAGRGALDSCLLNKILDGSRKNESILRRLLRLWSKIARLFDVEGTGLFRLKPNDYQTHLRGPDDESKNEKDKLENGECSNLCSSETEAQEVVVRKCIDCNVCSSGIERVLRNKSSPRAGELLFNGIGCALLTEACCPSEMAGMFNGISVTPGKLGVMKNLLYRVASHVPPTLCRIPTLERLNPGVPLTPKELTNCPIWTDPHFDTWSAFVENSRDVRMLAQAFLLLACSINTSKLPMWWRSARAGWSNAYALMNSPSLSSLALQLYVLDAALAETILGHSESSPGSVFPVQSKTASENELSQLETIEEKMLLVLKWADELSLERYSGEYNEHCVECDDGGTLMCCEFCQNVQHMYCCTPPIFEEPQFDWVCSDCISSIIELRN